MASLLGMLNRMTSRALFAATTLFLAYFLARIETIVFSSRTIRELSRHTVDSGWYEIYLVAAVVFAIQWAFSISGRMFDLRLRRQWILPYLGLWGAALLAMAKGSSRQFLVTLALTIVAQLPLMLIPSRRTKNPSTTVSAL